MTIKLRLQLASLYLWLLALAILLTIGLAWAIYPLEIDWLGLERVVYLTKATISTNFNQLMAYLTLPWEWQFNLPAFASSASGRHHFLVVKYLFHLAQAVCLVLAYPALTFLMRTLKARQLWYFRRFLAGAALLPVIFGLLAVLIGFDQFFTLFHQLLFVGDNSWLFNPLTDPVIYILPETYFLHAFLIFALLYEALFCGLLVTAWYQNRHAPAIKSFK